MTFEAWIAMPLPTDGQYKPIVSRYPSPDRIGLPDLDLGITETNRFCGPSPHATLFLLSCFKSRAVLEEVGLDRLPTLKLCRV